MIRFVSWAGASGDDTEPYEESRHDVFFQGDSLCVEENMSVNSVDQVHLWVHFKMDVASMPAIRRGGSG